VELFLIYQTGSNTILDGKREVNCDLMSDVSRSTNVWDE